MIIVAYFGVFVKIFSRPLSAPIWSCMRLSVRIKALCSRSLFIEPGHVRQKPPTLCPNAFCMKTGSFFAVGYHHAGERIETVDLHDIAEIQLVQLHSPKTERKAKRVWDEHEA